MNRQELWQLDAYWRAANYLTACQLYLLDNPCLSARSKRATSKQTIVGHWGTCPGQNFIYTHLNRVIKRDDLDMIYLSGPGHGGNAMVAQDWLDGSYTEVYPNITRDKEGMQRLFKRFLSPAASRAMWRLRPPAPFTRAVSWATSSPTPSARWRTIPI